MFSAAKIKEFAVGKGGMVASIILGLGFLMLAATLEPSPQPKQSTVEPTPTAVQTTPAAVESTPRPVSPDHHKNEALRLLASLRADAADLNLKLKEQIANYQYRDAVKTMDEMILKVDAFTSDPSVAIYCEQNQDFNNQVWEIKQGAMQVGIDRLSLNPVIR